MISLTLGVPIDLRWSLLLIWGSDHGQVCVRNTGGQDFLYMIPDKG